MKSKNQRKTDAVIFRALGFLIAVSGVIVRLFDASLSGNAFIYFDMQVAVIIAISFAALLTLTVISVIKNGQIGDSPTFSFTAHYLLVALTVADAVIFWSIISWAIIPSGFLFTPSKIIIHGFLPVIVVIDWFLFCPHGKLSFISSVFSLLYPAVYYVFAFIISTTGLKFGEGTYGEFYREIFYPYFFLQENAVGGLFYLFLILIAFAAAFYAFSIVTYFADGLLARDKKKKAQSFYDPEKEKKKRK